MVRRDGFIATHARSKQEREEKAKADKKKEKDSHVTVVPVQEHLQPSEQDLLTPPRSKMRFWLVECLLERLFPPIRILGANIVDGFIYLKFFQLLILLVVVMNVVCVGILLPPVRATEGARALPQRRAKGT